MVDGRSSICFYLGKKKKKKPRKSSEGGGGKEEDASLRTCVKVVLCRRRAGVGQLAVVGVWPMWGLEAQGSGFSFLKAPSAPAKTKANDVTSNAEWPSVSPANANINAL